MRLQGLKAVVGIANAGGTGPALQGSVVGRSTLALLIARLGQADDPTFVTVAPYWRPVPVSLRIKKG